MATTYTSKVCGTGEEFTYTVYAGYIRDDYADGSKRYNQYNNLARCAVLRPLPDDGWYEVCLTDEPPGEDFFTSGYILFNQRKDAELVCKAWVLRKV